MGNKLYLDKYYTPKNIAVHCYNLAIEKIGKENISEIIEPSAGSGVFLDCDDSIIGYDIEPEDDRIIAQDYLQLNVPYKKGRLILGNPPYGRCLNLAQKFYKKSVELGDYIAFILPISQFNNNRTFYDFDLIYSEDLGEALYSDIKLHCVFNIYSRPLKGLNSKKEIKLKDIQIVRQDSKNYDKIDYDVRMCYWGNGSAGKILENESEHYSGEYKIIVKNKEHKEEIVEFIKNFDWNSYTKGIAMKRIKQYNIIEVLKENFDYLI